MTNDQRIEALIDLIRDDGPTINEGIEAIKEMQAELATRETGESKDSSYSELPVRLKAERDAAISERDELREELREELRFARISWSFADRKRIMAECDDLRCQRDHAQTLAGHLRSEREAAMVERDSLRDKLRVAEEGMNIAEAEVDSFRARCDTLETEMDSARLFRGRTGEVWFEEVQRLLTVIESSRSALNQASRDE